MINAVIVLTVIVIACWIALYESIHEDDDYGDGF